MAKCIDVEGLNAWFGAFQALADVSQAVFGEVQHFLARRVARIREVEQLADITEAEARGLGSTDEAKAFEGLADEAPQATSWYRSSEPFSTLAFANAIDGFTVTTTGTISAGRRSSSSH